MKTLEEIYNYMLDNIHTIDTFYEDESGRHYGYVDALCEDDLFKVVRAIEDLLS